MAHDPHASKERANALTIMIALLRDAGADDLVATLTAEQAATLYRDVVRAVRQAAQTWREHRHERTPMEMEGDRER